MRVILPWLLAATIAIPVLSLCSAQPPAAKTAPAPDPDEEPLPAGAIARIGTTQLRHDAPIAALAWSHDSSFIASASHDKTACLWDAKTGKLKRRITGHTDAVFALALTMDSKKLATGSRDKTVRLWDVATGKEIWRSDGHKESVSSVAFSPDDKVLATGGFDGKVRLWDVAGGMQLAEFTDANPAPPAQEVYMHRETETSKPAVCCLAFSPDGATLASGGKNQAVHLWDVKTGKKTQSWKADPPATILGVAFAPDGKTLATASPAGTRLWDVSNGTMPVALEGPDFQGSGVQFNKDGNTLVSSPAQLSYEQKHIRVSDAKAGHCKFLIQPGSVDWLLAAVMSPDGQTLACAGVDNIIRLLDSATGKERIGDARENRILRHIALSRDGKHLAVESRTGTITLHDATTGNAVRQLTSEGNHFALPTFCANGEILLINEAKNTLHAIDVASATKREIGVPIGSSAHPIAVSHDASVFAFPGSDGDVCIWDAVQGRLIKRLEIGLSKFSVLALSPNGSLLAVNDISGPFGEYPRTELWDTAKGLRLRNLTESRYTIYGLAFSPDGFTVAGVRGRGAVLWETGSGLIRGQLEGDWNGRASRLAFSPDKRTLAIGKDAGYKISFAVDDTGGYRYNILVYKRPPGDAELWDLRTGAVYATLHGHLVEVTQLAFSGDGKKLATLGWEGTAFVRDVPQPAMSPAIALTPDQLPVLWAKLGGNNCPAAYAAHWQLVASKGPTVAFLKQHLKPIPHADPAAVTAYRAALDSDTYAVREKAAASLKKLGPDAEPILIKLLEGQPSLELRLRVESLLKPFDNSSPSLELLRQDRAVEVLERIGDADARDLLKSLATGAPGVRLTTQAQAALDRLKAPDD